MPGMPGESMPPPEGGKGAVGIPWGNPGGKGTGGRIAGRTIVYPVLRSTGIAGSRAPISAAFGLA